MMEHKTSEPLSKGWSRFLCYNESPGAATWETAMLCVTAPEIHTEMQHWAPHHNSDMSSSMHCKLKIKVTKALTFSIRITTANAWAHTQLQQQPPGTESLPPFSCELPLQFPLCGFLLHKVWYQPWGHKDGSHFLISKSHQYHCLFVRTCLSSRPHFCLSHPLPSKHVSQRNS